MIEKNRNKLLDQSIYDMLPKDLKKITKNFKERDRDIVLLSSIGVLSNCFPNVQGEYRDEIVTPHLYIVFLAPAASGKGVMNYSKKIIETTHKYIYEKTKSQRKKCEEENKQNGKEERKECPQVQIKILPGNISSADMYNHLHKCRHGLLIFETEADTIGQMLKNDWSNYSDVLRKAYHHESISISRYTEGLYREVDNPKLAMVLSGTPEQLKPLIQSKENGLFSRLTFYTFDEIKDFNLPISSNRKNKVLAFCKLGYKINELNKELSSLKNPVILTMTVSQKKKLNQTMKRVSETVRKKGLDGFLSNVFRHGLMLFRIAQVLTCIRNLDNLPELQKLKIDDRDFDNAVNIIEYLLFHALYVYKTINQGVLSIQDTQILDCIVDILRKRKDKTDGTYFSTKTAIEVGEKFGVNRRTMTDKLHQWQRRKIIKRFAKGLYKIL